ncbi:ATP-dependent DNA ligase [Cryobacterium tagatosivorans]|uniref:ATP-dependent DNA ligase n=1 Tax=Cryobacterium tagatosivorans TaxID=1259199 RepID=A0A4V3I676_9MICO|nr:ATP-dependent DNA ligase [Cryobacterium tagatosivorans]TFB48148.1 ATP-dependent DNA ligase [Cryobacterium tagatosivorans]
MGSLTYDKFTIEFDDRMLAHLQIVIVQKLRRGESFVFSWRNAPEAGDGRSAIWLHEAIPLYFRFSGSRSPEINVQWVAALTRTANGSQGLLAIGESDVRTLG